MQAHIESGMTEEELIQEVFVAMRADAPAFMFVPVLPRSFPDAPQHCGLRHGRPRPADGACLADHQPGRTRRSKMRSTRRPPWVPQRHLGANSGAPLPASLLCARACGRGTPSALWGRSASLPGETTSMASGFLVVPISARVTTRSAGPKLYVGR